MHAAKRLSLALTVALSALVVPGVRAQQPAIPQPSPLPLNQPVTYGYTDAQGPGSITLTDVGADPATGGRQLRVSIVKGGVQANGSGLTYLLTDLPPALNNLITFSVVVPNGTPYFYQGKMGLNGVFQGQGTFHLVSDPTQSASWSMIALPPITLNRTYISFSSVQLGGTAGPLCFTMTNTSGAPLTINSISVANCSSSIDAMYIDCTQVAGFEISSGAGSGILAPGQSHDVCLTFTPREAATFDASVMISTSASTTPMTVKLHGTGD
jgi:hypothetical protein